MASGRRKDGSDDEKKVTGTPPDPAKKVTRTPPHVDGKVTQNPPSRVFVCSVPFPILLSVKFVLEVNECLRLGECVGLSLGLAGGLQVRFEFDHHSFERLARLSVDVVLEAGV